MAERLDSMPKVFRRILCCDCSQEFQATGPAAKRCEPCRAAYKNSYERERDRATRARPIACIDCSVPFSPDIHASTKRCEPCSALHWKQVRAEYQKADKNRRSAYAKKSYDKNQTDILKRRKSEKFRKENAARIKARRQRNPGYRLHCNISRIVALSLNGDKGGRRWELLLGYTRQQLIVHLERQFTKGMTWENMGGETGWQVDHIIPRASFTFATADDHEFKACWALTNLRPLWRVDNLTKREKRLHLI
jgi:hypothetical protein